MGSEIAETDVAVVGGGLAGLAAAATAARRGARVVLFDAGALGGRARSTERDGFTLNAGPHALYQTGEAARVLDGLGVPRHGAPPWSRYAGSRSGRLHRLPTGPVSLLRTTALRPGSKVRVAKLLAQLPRLDVAALADRSVDEWLDAEDLPDDVADLLRTLVRLATYTDAPDRLSAGVAVSQLQLAAAGGVAYVDGGWSTLVEGLRLRAREAGVEIVPGVRATGVVENGRDGRSVVQTAAGNHRALAVVVAAGTPDGAAAVLGDRPTTWDRIGPPVLAACLDVGLRRLPAHQVVLGLDRPTYFSVHGPPARLAPEGAYTAHAAHYLAPGTTPSSEDERRLLRAVAAEAGVEDGDIVTERFLPRMVVAGGFPTAEAGGYAGRPGIEVPDRPGVFVAGDWVGDAGLLADAALASGELAGLRAADAVVGPRRRTPSEVPAP